jgi:DNA-directed RNA polymerase subunit RPC12/RpoP
MMLVRYDCPECGTSVLLVETEKPAPRRQIDCRNCEAERTVDGTVISEHSTATYPALPCVIYGPNSDRIH